VVCAISSTLPVVSELLSGELSRCLTWGQMASLNFPLYMHPCVIVSILCFHGNSRYLHNKIQHVTVYIDHGNFHEFKTISRSSSEYWISACDTYMFLAVSRALSCLWKQLFAAGCMKQRLFKESPFAEHLN